MALPSRKETYDSNTQWDLSSRTSINGALLRRLSKGTSIQSYRGSISNSSLHTNSTVATHNDLFEYSEQGLGGAPSISHRKSFHTLEKTTFRLRNQSQSTVGTTREAGSVRSSTASSTSEQEIHSLHIPSFEDEGDLPLLSEPGPTSSRIYGVPSSTPLDNPLTKPYGDSQPFTTTKFLTPDRPRTRHPSSLPPLTDCRGTTSLSHTATSYVPVSSTVTDHNVYDTSIEELSKAEVYATATKYPFIPSTQALPPPSSHNASKSSRSQQMVTPSVPPTPPHLSEMNRVGLADFYADSLGTAPALPLDGLPDVSFSPTPADGIRVTLCSRVSSVTAKGKRGMTGLMTDFLKSHKRPETSRAYYDPVHVTHMGFNSFTGEPKSVKASAEESRNSPNADGAVGCQATVDSNGTVAERPASLQRSAAVASLAKAAAAPMRREKKKQDKAKDADIIRRLRQICTDADPTRSYHNFVKIGQG